MNEQKDVLIFGATGNVGGAAARELLRRGWQVRAVTRNPQGENAQALAVLGAELVQADMEDRQSLEAAFDGVQRVFSVQNWVTHGVEGEIRQGKIVADAALAAGVSHIVYGSAGIGEPGTGVPHFENKLVIEGYMRDLGLPLTIVRPGPFMELMSAKEFFPTFTAWGAMPKVIGWDTPTPWIAVEDIGTTIANVFADPHTWIGRDVKLIGDVRSLRQCQADFQTVHGKKPFGLPLPLGLFKRMAGEEFLTMIQWMDSWINEKGPEYLWGLVEDSREALPEPHDVASWLASAANGQNGR